MAVMNPVTRLPLLRPVPIFRGLAKQALLEVARKSTEVTFGPNEAVVEQGAPGDALFVVVRGTVEVLRNDRVVAQMTAGDFFGELSLIDGKPRSATVVAVDDVELLTISSDDFNSLLADQYFARAAIKSLAERLREAYEAQGKG